MRTRHNSKPTRGFTLIEILIVVVILGILAAIVIPQFAESAESANENSAKSTLQTVRTQFELAKFHGDLACDDDLATILAGLVGDGYLQADPVLPGDYQLGVASFTTSGGTTCNRVVMGCATGGTCAADVADW